MSVRRKTAAQRGTRSTRKALINATGTTQPTTATPSPISKLPNEVLGHVFENYVSLDQPPWCIVLVSECWKSIALSNPRLWTNIMIFKNDSWSQREAPKTIWHIPGEPEPMYAQGRRQICNTEGKLRAALSRSGALPIRLWYQWRDGDNISPTGPLLFKIALERSTASRIESLFIGAHQSAFTASLNALPRDYFPRLRSIGVSQRHRQESQDYLFSLHQTAPNLVELELHCRIHVQLTSLPFLEKIRILRINREWVPLEFAARIIPNCPHLVEFADYGKGWFVADMDGEFKTPAYRLGKPSFEAFARVKFQRLQSMYLSEFKLYDGHSPIELPHLTSLSIRVKNIHFLQSLYTPSLISLTVETMDGSQEPRYNPTFYSSIGFSSVTSFRMKSHFSEQVFAGLIHSLPNVEDIHLIQTGHRSPFSDHRIFNGLEITSTGGACTRLKKMTLGNKENPTHFRRLGINRMIDPVTKSRDEAGLLVPRFNIHWSNPATKDVTILLFP